MIYMMKRCVLSGALVLSVGLAWGQQIAVTFDDLPVHGAMPAGMTRSEIAESILKTLKREKLPPGDGFINGGGGGGESDPPPAFEALRGGRPPVGKSTLARLALYKEKGRTIEAAG